EGEILDQDIFKDISTSIPTLTQSQSVKRRLSNDSSGLFPKEIASDGSEINHDLETVDLDPINKFRRTNTSSDFRVASATDDSRTQDDESCREADEIRSERRKKRKRRSRSRSRSRSRDRRHREYGGESRQRDSGRHRSSRESHSKYSSSRDSNRYHDRVRRRDRGESSRNWDRDIKSIAPEAKVGNHKYYSQVNGTNGTGRNFQNFSRDSNGNARRGNISDQDQHSIDRGVSSLKENSDFARKSENSLVSTQSELKIKNQEFSNLKSSFVKAANGGVAPEIDVSMLSPEEDEESLIEERRKKRLAILEKHKTSKPGTYYSFYF
ncbi:hypothetical protein HK096_001332, partial [Nowakowskiella sp. JEL0078]